VAETNLKQVLPMLRILVIDDEESARFIIRHIIDEYCPDVELVGEADGVESGIAQINALQPDLVLLDIHLKDGSGFDLLRTLDVIRFKVVFVTAYEKYAIEAIKFSALNYFLKPVDPQELATLLNFYAPKTERENTALKLNAFFTNLMPDFEGKKKIVLEGDSGVFLVNINDIIWCENLENQTRFFLKNAEKITINKPMKAYLDLLLDQKFFRLNKNFLVNLRQCTGFDESGASNIITSDNCFLPFNPEKRKGLQQSLANL